MALKLANLELFDPADIKVLEAAGIATADDLVLQASGREQRNLLALRSGVSSAALLKLARMADLLRIAGINEAHTQLLDSLNVGSVAELKRQDASLLTKALRRKNVELTLVRSVPPESIVARWISDANSLPLVLEL